MTKPPASAPKPTPAAAPHPGVLMARIRKLATEGSYSWGPHVFERQDLRDIDINDAVRVLRLGEIEGTIEAGINPGEWKCKVTAKPEGKFRELGVAVVVIRDDELFLMTVEWEDIK